MSRRMLRAQSHKVDFLSLSPSERPKEIAIIYTSAREQRSRVAALARKPALRFTCLSLFLSFSLSTHIPSLSLALAHVLDLHMNANSPPPARSPASPVREMAGRYRILKNQRERERDAVTRESAQAQVPASIIGYRESFLYSAAAVR